MSYRQLFSEFDDMDAADSDSDMHEGYMALRRKASLDALRVYTGALAPFGADSGSRELLDERGFGWGDPERLDLGQLASEMVRIEVTLNGKRESSVGSPSPSSDTLSVAPYRAVRSTKREGTKHRRRVGMKRRGTVDRTKTPRGLYSTAK